MEVSDEEDERVITPAMPAIAKPKEPANKSTAAKSSETSSGKAAKPQQSKGGQAAKPSAKAASKSGGIENGKAPLKQKPVTEPKKHSKAAEKPKEPTVASKPLPKGSTQQKPTGPTAGEGDVEEDEDEEEDEEFSDVDEDEDSDEDSEEDSEEDSDDSEGDEQPLAKKRVALEEAERAANAAKKAKRGPSAAQASTSTAIVPVAAPTAMAVEGDPDANTGLAKTFSLLTKTAGSMENVFPSSVCTDLRVEAERVKQQLLDPTKPAEDVLHETIAKLLKSLSPHVANDTGVSASSLAVASAASEGLQKAADAFHLIMSTIKPMEERALELRDAVHQSSEKMQAAYGDLFR
jgi:hypothetical protein